MVKLVLGKGKNFELAPKYVRERLEEIFNREFGSVEEVEEELFSPDSLGVPRLPGTVYLPREIILTTNAITLPHTIDEWPIYGPLRDGIRNREIAKIKVLYE